MNDKERIAELEAENERLKEACTKWEAKWAYQVNQKYHVAGDRDQARQWARFFKRRWARAVYQAWCKERGHE